MLCASFNVCPLAKVLPTRSEPARSTNEILLLVVLHLKSNYRLEGVALLGDELQLELGVRELRDELVVGEGPRVEVRGHARELRLLEEAVRAVAQDAVEGAGHEAPGEVRVHERLVGRRRPRHLEQLSKPTPCRRRPPIQ